MIDWKKVLFFVAAIGFAFGCGVLLAMLNTRAVVSDLRKQNKAVTDQLGQARADIETARLTSAELEKRIGAASRELADATSRADRLSTELGRLEKVINGLGNTVGGIDESARSLDDIIGQSIEILRGLQEVGGIGD